MSLERYIEDVDFANDLLHTEHFSESWKTTIDPPSR